MLVLLAGTCFAQRRYYHETGLAILRVDEGYPGAFVEHRYVATGADNLFRAFLAVGSHDRGVAYGSAHEDAPLYDGTFSLLDSLVIEDSTSWVVTDTDSTGAPVDSELVLISSTTEMSYVDTLVGVTVRQHVFAENDSGRDIPVTFVIENTGEDSIIDFRVVMFYDGDIPDWGYEDDYPFSINYLEAVAVRDGSGENGVCSGFCGLIPDSGMVTGAWKDWVDTTGIDTFQIDTLVFEPPGWPADSEISAGDWSVFGRWEFGDLAPGDSAVMSIAFLVSDSTGFDTLAAEVRGDSVTHISETERPIASNIIVAPNPFNASCRIDVSKSGFGASDLEIFDIGGRLVRKIAVSRGSFSSPITFGQSFIWDGRDNGGRKLPSGVYLIRINSTNRETATGKVILLR